MYKEIFSKNLSILERQRNMFVILFMLSVVSNIILTIRLCFADEKIVMVPGLDSNMWLGKYSVSESYIEEVSVLLLSHLLDINVHNIPYKKSLILKNVSSKEAALKIEKYFFEAEKKYRKFDLSTYFTLKDIAIDPTSLNVKASGVLSSNYGKRGNSNSEKTYQIQFEYKFGRLKLKSFESVVENEK